MMIKNTHSNFSRNKVWCNNGIFLIKMNEPLFSVLIAENRKESTKTRHKIQKYVPIWVKVRKHGVTEPPMQWSEKKDTNTKYFIHWKNLIRIHLWSEGHGGQQTKISTQGWKIKFAVIWPYSISHDLGIVTFTSWDQDSLVCFGLAQNCYDIYIGCPQSTTLVYANIAENCYSIDRGCMWEMPSLKNFRISTLIEMCERCRQRRDIWLILWERDVDNGDRVAS